MSAWLADNAWIIGTILIGLVLLQCLLGLLGSVRRLQHGSSQRQLDLDIEAIHREAEESTRAAKIEQKRAIESARDQVRLLAMGVPAALLAMLAIGVFAHRLKGERLTVPASRQRSES